MIIALLFNWRAYSESGNYWHEIRDAVFSTGIIQRSGRHMKLSIGDVLVGIERGQDPEALFMAAFANSEWGCVHEERLLEGFPTVFGMVFENMPTALAEELSDALFEHAGFMGAISIHLEFPPHLALYRLRLPPQYRIESMKLRSFYSIGNQDGCDPSDLEDMQRLGYEDTAFEDTGAGRTILDDFDTPRHFERVAAFRTLLGVAERFLLVAQRGGLDLHRFRSGLLRAILAIKETGYGSDTQRRVQAGCGSHRANQWPDTASGCV